MSAADPLSSNPLHENSPHPGATEARGIALAHLLRPGDIILIEGELDTDKTALARDADRYQWLVVSQEEDGSPPA